MKTKKRLASLMMALTLVLVIIAGCSSDSGVDGGAKKLKIAMVTDTGGLGDQAFNDAAYEGLEKAKEEYGVEISVIESKEVGDYLNNMRTFASGKYDMIIAVGAAQSDAANEVSKDYPDTKFVVIDGGIEGVDNIKSLRYREQEAAYLAGAFAGLMTKSNEVSFLGGIKNPVIERAEVGFRAGAEAANPNVKVTVGYVGSFSDVGKGKEIALTMFKQGADFVAPFAGPVNLGVFQAAEESGSNAYAIGAATGQFHMSKKIMASQVKLVNNSVKEVVGEFAAGNFTPGISISGLKEQTVDLLFAPDEQLAQLIPDDVEQKLDEMRKDIIEGKIVPPSTPQEYQQMKGSK